MYRWVDSEVLGYPSGVTSEFLAKFQEENLITPEGEYEEIFTLEVPHEEERICYINHGRGRHWMWMYDVLISKFGVRLPFTDFQMEILSRTLVAPTQLHPNSWAMMRAFEIISQHLGIPPSPNAFFYLFTLTRPSGGGLTSGWLSFRAHVNRKIFLLYEESFHDFKPVYFKIFPAPDVLPFWEYSEGEIGRVNVYWNRNFDIPRVDEGDLTPDDKAFVEYLLLSFGEKHLNLKALFSLDVESAGLYLDQEMARKEVLADLRRLALKASAGNSGGSLAPPEGPRVEPSPARVVDTRPSKK